MIPSRARRPKRACCTPIGDEHNLRMVEYTDFSQAEPTDPRLQPLDDVSIYEFGVSNLSGEWFRHVREKGVSGEGIRYEVRHQTPTESGAAYRDFRRWNGYTVFRFDKTDRSVGFEIWTRHGEDRDYRPKDPRREAPDFYEGGADFGDVGSVSAVRD